MAGGVRERWTGLVLWARWGDDRGEGSKSAKEWDMILRITGIIPSYWSAALNRQGGTPAEKREVPIAGTCIHQGLVQRFRLGKGQGFTRVQRVRGACNDTRWSLVGGFEEMLLS
jgi:hypothetical protein